MTKRLHSRWNQSGQTLTEFAMVAVVFFLLTLAVFNFGGVIMAYNWVSNASHDGARWASVRGNTAPSAAATADVQNFVKSELSLDNSQGELTVTPSFCLPNVTPCTPDNSPGSVAQVTVTYSYSIWLPLLGNVSFPLTSTAQLVISQ